MVTKWLIYKKEKVKFWFMADAPMGSPPPYKNWKLIGVTDPKNDNLLDSLEPQELKKRMSRRLRKN